MGIYLQFVVQKCARLWGFFFVDRVQRLICPLCFPSKRFSAGIKMARMQLRIHRKASTWTEWDLFTFHGAGSDVRTATRSSKSQLFNE